MTSSKADGGPVRPARILFRKLFYRYENGYRNPPKQSSPFVYSSLGDRRPGVAYGFSLRVPKARSFTNSKSNAFISHPGSHPSNASHRRRRLALDLSSGSPVLLISPFIVRREYGKPPIWALILNILLFRFLGLRDFLRFFRQFNFFLLLSNGSVRFNYSRRSPRSFQWKFCVNVRILALRWYCMGICRSDPFFF